MFGGLFKMLGGMGKRRSRRRYEPGMRSGGFKMPTMRSISARKPSVKKAIRKARSNRDMDARDYD